MASTRPPQGEALWKAIVDYSFFLAVAVAVYEVLRRMGFDGLKVHGALGKGAADA